MFPAQVFFRPNDTFVEWTRSDFLRYRNIVDCGAGVGHVGAVLKNRLVPVTSIDLHARDSYESPVSIGDSTKYDFQSTDVVLICRPCHSHFVERTFRRAFDYGCIDVFYVGLDRNIDVDFDTSEWVFERILEAVGVDGEHVYRIYGPRNECRNYVCVSHVHSRERVWGEYVGGLIVNSMGGGYNIEPSEVINAQLAIDDRQISRPLAVQFAKNSDAALRGMVRTDDIVMIETGLEPRTNRGGYGWVAPDGAWYPCGSRDHETLIHDVFGIDSRIEQTQNWVKAYGIFWACSDYDRKANFRQRRTLRSLGFTDVDEQEERTMDTLPYDEQC